MKKSRQFLINIGVLTVSSFLLRSIQLSFSVYLSNTIGAEAMGIFHLVLSVYFFGVTLSTSGIGLTMTKLISEELALGNERKASSLLRKGICYCLIFSLIAAVLLVGLAPFLVRTCFQGIITPLPLYILAFGLPFLSVSSALSGYFTARRKAYRTAFGQLLEQMVKIGATVFLLYLCLPKGLTPTLCALVLGGTVSEVVSFLYLWSLYRRDTKRVAAGEPGSGQWKKLLGFSLPIAISSYLRSGLSSVKQLMIPAGMKKSGIQNAMAQYGAVNAMVFPILMFPQVLLSAFSSLLVPEITEKYALQQKKGLQRILSRIFKVTLVFAVGTGGILFLYAGDLCLAFYQNREIAYYLKLLAPLVVIMYLDDIVDAVLKGINCQVAVVRINIIDSVTGIFLLWKLLPLYHIKGYLMVIYVGEILNGTLSILKLMKHTEFSLSPVRWILIPAVVIWIGMLSARILIPFSMVGSIALSVLLYGGILYAVGILKADDFRI